MTLGFGAFLYSPVVFVTNGAQSLVANEFVQAQSSEVFFSAAYRHVAETFADYIRDIPKSALIFLSILIGLGLYRAARQRNWNVLLILPCIVAASAWLFFMKHAIPFPRTWIFMIPFVLIIADGGWNYCMDKLSKPLRSAAVYGLHTSVAFYALFLISTNAIAKYPDTGTFTEAPVVAKYLGSVMNKGDAVDGLAPVDYPTYFYFWYHYTNDIRPRRDDPLRRKFFIVKKSDSSIEATTRHKVAKVVEFDDAVNYESLIGEATETPCEPDTPRDQNCS
jgi:hypothetical protein